MRLRRRVRAERERPILIPDTKAVNYVGRYVTVEGVVASITSTRGSRMRVLHLGAPRSDETLAVWIPAGVIVPTVERLRGRRVRVTGAVWMYEGMSPALTLADASALTL